MKDLVSESARILRGEQQTSQDLNEAASPKPGETLRNFFNKNAPVGTSLRFKREAEGIYTVTLNGAQSYSSQDFMPLVKALKQNVDLEDFEWGKRGDKVEMSIVVGEDGVPSKMGTMSLNKLYK